VAPLFALGLLGAILAGCGEDQAPRKDVDKLPTAIGQTDLGKKNTTQTKTTKTTAVPRGKGFDFYVLSLSWSPSWCAENDSGGRTEQCRKGGGYGFIVHGLWPQNERGYPEFCPTRQSDRVPESLGRTIMDIIPSMGLIGHQWRKHGSCSGLSQKDYFAVTRAARERVTIPDELVRSQGEYHVSPQAVEKEFIAANPGLGGKGIAVTCESGRLAEIRLCLTPDLAFRDCLEIDRNACRTGSIIQPPAR
jgi:ribonuclease T2